VKAKRGKVPNVTFKFERLGKNCAKWVNCPGSSIIGEQSIAVKMTKNDELSWEFEVGWDSKVHPFIRVWKGHEFMGMIDLDSELMFRKLEG